MHTKDLLTWNKVAYVRNSLKWSIATQWGEIELLAQADDRADLEAAVTQLSACVNACRGINPEAVPKLVEALEGMVEGAECVCVDGERQFHKTRFSEGGQCLLYAKVDKRTWSFFHMDTATDKNPARVGPLYASKAELLADAERYGREFGF